MRTPDEVAAMLRLKALGWGIRRIAREARLQPHDGAALSWPRRLDGPYRRAGRPPALDGLEDWLAERFRRHRGNADVVRQDLEREHGIEVSLRTVERAVAPLRRELAAEARATVRFETPPGHQLQIDFGELRVAIGGEGEQGVPVRGDAGLLAALHVRAFRHRAAVGLVRRDRGRLPALRRRAARGAARQRRGAGRAPRRGDARGPFNAAPSRLRPLLGLPAAGLRAVPGADQGQGRARRRLREAQRDRRRTLRRAGRRWRRIWRAGRARSPTCGSTARPARRRSSGSRATRRRRCRPLDGRPPFQQIRELSRAWSRRTAASRSTATPTACPGG